MDAEQTRDCEERREMEKKVELLRLKSYGPPGRSNLKNSSRRRKEQIKEAQPVLYGFNSLIR